MSIKISNWVIAAILIGIGVLVIALIRGCSKVKKDAENARVLASQVDSLKKLNKDVRVAWVKSDNEYKDSLEFERGQRLLTQAQKERTEDELNKEQKKNQQLIQKYKEQDYEDTSMVAAPAEFVSDCHDCFKRLEITNNLTLKYKKEVNDWADKYKNETARINGRVVQVEKERDSYRFSVDSVASLQKKEVRSIRPKGRLYLSWGVLWNGWPSAAGAGLMYQTPRNVFFGVKGYYGAGKTTVETTINFPLSLKRK